MEGIHYAVLDIGTTSTRCFIYNQDFEIIATASRDIQILMPKHGYSEIEPESLIADVIT